MTKDPVIFLKHIIESIEAIEQYTKDLSSEENFLEDQESQDSVIRRLEIIGEAIKSLPEETKEQATEIAWRKIVAMRNLLIHEYFGIELSLVWRVVHNDLPSLKNEIIALLEILEK